MNEREEYGQILDIYGISNTLLRYWWAILLIVGVFVISGYFLSIFVFKGYEGRLKVSPNILATTEELEILRSEKLLPDITEEELYFWFVNIASEIDQRAEAVSISYGETFVNDQNDKMLGNEWHAKSNTAVIYNLDPAYSTLFVKGEDASKIEQLLINWVDITSKVLANELSESMKFNLEILVDQNELEIQMLEQEIDLMKQMHVVGIEDQKIQVQNQINEAKDFHKKTYEDQIFQTEVELTILKDKHTKILKDDALEIQLDIDKLKDQHNHEMSDRVDFLREQHEIASKLGMEELAKWGNPAADGTAIASVTNVEDPYFFLGTKAIQTEIKQIESRETHDPFIEDLRELEKEMAVVKARIGKDEFVPDMRVVEARLDLHRSKLNYEEFINDLPALQAKLLSLEKSKGDEFVNGLRDKQAALAKAIDNVALNLSRKLYDDSKLRKNQIGLTQYDTAAINIRKKISLAKILILCFAGGVGVATISVLGIDGYNRARVSRRSV